MKQHPGKCLQQFLDNCQYRIYNGVDLTPCDITEEQLCAKKHSLIEAVIDHVTNRLSDLETSDTVKAMQAFFVVNPPDTDGELATYGEQPIQTLCGYFEPVLARLGCQVQEILDTEWSALKTHMRRHSHMSNETFYHRLFTSGNLKERFKNILMLVEIILSIPKLQNEILLYFLVFSIKCSYEH